jgi:hypothetical protein
MTEKRTKMQQQQHNSLNGHSRGEWKEQDYHGNTTRTTTNTRSECQCQCHRRHEATGIQVIQSSSPLKPNVLYPESIVVAKEANSKKLKQGEVQGISNGGIILTFTPDNF